MRTTFALFALSASALLASAAPTPGGGGYGGYGNGADVFINSPPSLKLHKDVKVSLKEVCYRDLYANVEEFKKETDKQILIKDDHGSDVFIFDGFLRNSENVEFYFREFCYKDFNFKAHKDKESKQQVIDINSDDKGHGKGKGYWKRSIGPGFEGGIDNGVGTGFVGNGFDNGVGTGGFDGEGFIGGLGTYGGEGFIGEGFNGFGAGDVFSLGAWSRGFDLGGRDFARDDFGYGSGRFGGDEGFVGSGFEGGEGVGYGEGVGFGYKA